MFIILQLIAAQVGMFTDNIIERFFRDRLQYRMHNNRWTFGIFGCKRLTSIVNHGVKKDWWTHSAVCVFHSRDGATVAKWATALMTALLAVANSMHDLILIGLLSSCIGLRLSNN